MGEKYETETETYCLDCGKAGETTGHQDCMYPGAHLAAKNMYVRIHVHMYDSTCKDFHDM
jgi:hypothetical protein